MSDSASVDVLEVVVAPLGQDQSVALLLHKDEWDIMFSIYFAPVPNKNKICCEFIFPPGWGQQQSNVDILPKRHSHSSPSGPLKPPVGVVFTHDIFFSRSGCWESKNTPLLHLKWVIPERLLVVTSEEVPIATPEEWKLWKVFAFANRWKTLTTPEEWRLLKGSFCKSMETLSRLVVGQNVSPPLCLFSCLPHNCCSKLPPQQQKPWIFPSRN